jgi:hypothetical protein
MVPTGVPQGTKLGPWLFIVMIDELDIPNTELWKYVDDTTTSETVGRHQNSNIQTAADILVNRAATDKFQHNEEKCKELRTCFSPKNKQISDPIVINDNPIDIVTDSKILGLNVSYNLMWL